ncbi:MAG TPA: hypothetical protein VGJ33_14425 [Candidatus Angelobacter sp.]
MNESFDEAVQRFQAFLGSNGFPTGIAWLTASDVLITGARLIYVRDPDLHESENAARHAFELGLRGGNGVLLKALFFQNGTSYCSIWVPSDEREADLAHMPKGVKLQVVSSEQPDMVLVRTMDKWNSLAKHYGDMQTLRSEFLY